MGEPTGREGSSGELESGALPEGAQVAHGSAAGPAQCVGVPPLRVKYSRPDDLGLDSLDMLAALDEPELLMLALHRLASVRPGRMWAIVDQHAGFAIQSLKHANETPARVSDSHRA
jgi:hypothetical protein